MAQDSRYDREPAGRGYGRDRGEYRGPDYGRGEYRGRDYGRGDYGRDARGEAYREDRDYVRGGWGSNYDRGYGYGRDHGGREGGLGYGRGRAGRAGYGAGGVGYGREGSGYGGGYGREDYGRRSGEDYGRYHGREHDDGRSGHRGRSGEERGFWDRAGDEVSSWFGDEEAERRRRMDERQGGAGWYGEFRGRGPRNYTRSDDRIREDVSDRLSDDPDIDASDIEVRVGGGEITLDGTVRSRWDKRHAENISDSVSGVRHVQNNLRVQQAGTMGMASQADDAGQGAADGTASPTAANEAGPGRGRTSAA